MQVQGLFFDAGKQDRLQSRLFGAARKLQAIFIGGRFAAAEEANNHRLAAGAGASQHFLRHRRGRWLGDECNHLSALVGFQHLDGVEHHQAANSLAEIAPAGTNQLRHTAAEFVNAHAQLLAAGAGSADDANRAAAHRVSKAQSRAVDDGGAAIRPHHQQPFLVRQLLQRQLVVERHVIGKEHYVKIVFQRLARFAGGESTVDGNHRKVCVRTMGFGAGNRRVARFMGAYALFTREQRLDGRQRFIIRRVAFNHDHQVAVFGFR